MCHELSILVLCALVAPNVGRSCHFDDLFSFQATSREQLYILFARGSCVCLTCMALKAPWSTPGSVPQPVMIKLQGMQVMEFSICVVVARAFCGVGVAALSAALSGAAATLDSLFVGNPRGLLFTVMICCPLLMNLGQAWVQDHFLAWKSTAQAIPCRSRDAGEAPLGPPHLQNLWPNGESGRGRAGLSHGDRSGSHGHRSGRLEDFLPFEDQGTSIVSASGSLSSSFKSKRSALVHSDARMSGSL
jgi:hypothetical protein